MRIRVRVHPDARRERTEQRGGELHVWVSRPPVDGKANARVAELLAALHGLKKSAVRLVGGQASRTKVFELDVG